MAELDGVKIKKLVTGERWGVVALIVSGAAFVWFMVAFILGTAAAQYAYFKFVALYSALPPLFLGVGAAAFCNLKFGRAADREIKRYVVDVFVENAEKMHPERNTLSFFAAIEGNTVVLTVNGYKDRIVFDFSAFGKFGATRKIAAMEAITQRLNATFIRLWERGGDYTTVNYSEKAGTRRKSGRIVPVITDGQPDARAMKSYLKNK